MTKHVQLTLVVVLFIATLVLVGYVFLFHIWDPFAGFDPFAGDEPFPLDDLID